MQNFVAVSHTKCAHVRGLKNFRDAEYCLLGWGSGCPLETLFLKFVAIPNSIPLVHNHIGVFRGPKHFGDTGAPSPANGP